MLCYNKILNYASGIPAVIKPKYLCFNSKCLLMTVCTKLNFGKYLIILQNVVYICIFNIKFYLISPVFQEREGEPVSYTSFCQNQICESQLYGTKHSRHKSHTNHASCVRAHLSPINYWMPCH